MSPRDMFRAFSLVALLVQLGQTQTSEGNSSVSSDSDAARVHWLGSTPSHGVGTTFGVPWPKGKYPAEDASFIASAGNGEYIPLQSWVTSYWPDGSVKWSGHAIAPADATYDEYTISVSSQNSTASSSQGSEGGLSVTTAEEMIVVDNGAISVSFPYSGNNVVGEITADGKTVGRNGRLILSTQSAVDEDHDTLGSAPIEYAHFESNVLNVTVQEESSVRALVTVYGNHTIQANSSSTGTNSPWLPFELRFYMYRDSEAVKIVHSIVYDANQNTTFLRGMGLRFDVPLEEDELYDRHVRIAGQEGGFLRESPKGITGLRRDPGQEIKDAQIGGQKTPPLDQWDERVTSAFEYIPNWNDWRLDQLSPDGFTLKKRTDPGYSWVKIPGGTRAGGLAYLGGATTGGLAVGMRDFWQQYPVSLDISHAASDTGSITLWLHSPSADPMDLRPYHDSLGQETYEQQLDALDITYEDYEPGYDTPYGIGKTHELMLFAFNSTPSVENLNAMTETMNNPPVLVADPSYIAETETLGNYWAPPQNGSADSAEIESNLNFLVDFYIGQVDDHRWYGFWDYGDVMHTYDSDRHIWRYDVGGYAWDNGELSPELFFWQQFLRTGRQDLYHFAERLSRHGGEVDVYHTGPFAGLGTRHGVQHFSDSSKQVRVSQPQFRKPFFFLSGGDERTGALLENLMDADLAYLTVDVSRKIRDADFVYNPDPEALIIGLGTDWSGLAATWLIEWERRGPRQEEARTKLLNTMRGIGDLRNGFVTGEALYSTTDGTLRPPPPDANNTGIVGVSHLSAVFGLPEVIAEAATHMGSDFPESFDQAWLDYCTYYLAGSEAQAARYGDDFGSTSLEQGHSRLAAYAAFRDDRNETLSAIAWGTFYVNEDGSDGLEPSAPWESVSLDGPVVIRPLEEADWVSTNAVAQYGLAAIQNLRYLGAAPPPPAADGVEEEDGGS